MAPPSNGPWTPKSSGNMPVRLKSATSTGGNAADGQPNILSPPLISHSSVPSFDHEQHQQDEMSSLEAIYASDFKLTDGGGAWKVGCALQLAGSCGCRLS